MPYIKLVLAVIAGLALISFSLVFPSSANENLLSRREMSLQNRYPNKAVNEVFKDNILLTMAYMEGRVSNPKAVDWYDVQKPYVFEFTLKPNEGFAFHDDALASYKSAITKTTNAHFNAQEGFKSSGYLYGDGVCHLASVIYWAAKDAGLNTHAPTNHDFRKIPDVPREYGVSIYSMPGQTGANAVQNLYIKNTTEKPIVFRFEHDNQKIIVSVKKV